MSGNMSFLNGSSTSGRRGLAGHGRNLNGGGVNGSFGRGNPPPQLSDTPEMEGRGSTRFSESSSFSCDETSRKMEAEVIKDNDVWGTRIILSGLEEIAFAETPFPKLSSSVIQGLQKLFLSINGALSSSSPFYEQRNDAKNQNVSIGGTSCASGSTILDESQLSPGQEKPQYEIPKEILEVLESAPVESRVIIRTLITSYIKKTALKIIEAWRPVLEAEGVELPCVKQTASRIPTSKSFKRVETSEEPLTLADYNLPECLNNILSVMKTYQGRSQNLDVELRNALKLRNEEMLKYKQTVQILKEITLAILQERAAAEDPSFLTKYMDIIDLESKCIEEQLRLKNLHIEAAENPEDTLKDTEQMYQKVKIVFDQMQKKTLEMEENIEKYKSLASDNEYLRILQEYQALEEEIKTKEWVREQLLQGPKDDALLKDDSFFN